MNTQIPSQVIFVGHTSVGKAMVVARNIELDPMTGDMFQTFGISMDMTDIFDVFGPEDFEESPEELVISPFDLTSLSFIIRPIFLDGPPDSAGIDQFTSDENRSARRKASSISRRRAKS